MSDDEETESPLQYAAHDFIERVRDRIKRSVAILNVADVQSKLSNSAEIAQGGVKAVNTWLKANLVYDPETRQHILRPDWTTEGAKTTPYDKQLALNAIYRADFDLRRQLRALNHIPQNLFNKFNKAASKQPGAVGTEYDQLGDQIFSTFVRNYTDPESDDLADESESDDLADESKSADVAFVDLA